MFIRKERVPVSVIHLWHLWLRDSWTPKWLYSWCSDSGTRRCISRTHQAVQILLEFKWRKDAHRTTLTILILFPSMGLVSLVFVHRNTSLTLFFLQLILQSLKLNSMTHLFIDRLLFFLNGVKSYLVALQLLGSDLHRFLVSFFQVSAHFGFISFLAVLFTQVDSLDRPRNVPCGINSLITWHVSRIDHKLFHIFFLARQFIFNFLSFISYH